MVTNKETIDMQLKLIVERLNKLNYSKQDIKRFMRLPLKEYHDATAMEYIYLGLSHIVLNCIEEWNDTKS